MAKDLCRLDEICSLTVSGTRPGFKGTAQMIRDRVGKEVSRTFLAQSNEDVQDESYTRSDPAKVEAITRQLYAEAGPTIFAPITATDWPAVRRKIREEQALEFIGDVKELRRSAS